MQLVKHYNRIINAYPKYLLSIKDEPLEEMKQVIKVLERYNKSQEQIINVFNGAGENRSFNILAVILYLLNDYYEYGIYTNNEEIVEINGQGEILWDKTIDEGFAFIEKNQPYYIDFFTQKSIENDLDYFKRLHECILTECSHQLQEAKLDLIFEMEIPNLSEEKISDFGDREYILERIQKELNTEYSTRKIVLLKTIYAYISQNQKLFDENYGISMFGTTSFHMVWEKVCAKVFNNKSCTPLDQLNMTVPLTSEYHNKKNLIDIIEKPIWEGIDITQEANDTLTPDLINISQINQSDCFFILDAKYYNLQLEKGKRLRSNPGVGDVTKQYLYQLAYQKFINAHNISIVKNCFLLPTEKDEFLKKGIVKMPMLESLKLENIEIWQIPAQKIYEAYLTRKKLDLKFLTYNT